ncbi:glycosyltransferase family 4 protein [Rhodothermus marinus]|uniref:glycosyltransferase family 4 protein n=1 Tax=Rhodothermus marinus TaxID=29549 RepID=UPI001374E4DB|nr:glycosyltransferase family 4 protein [Rhodothermus marinus]
MGSRVVLVVPYAPAVPLFRLSLIKQLSERGDRPLIYAPDWTPELKEIVEKSTGAKACDYPLKRTGVSPFADLKTLVFLAFSLARLRPCVIITFQPKPNIYGILAAALARVPLRAAVVEGLGFAFTPGDNNLKKRMVRTVLQGLYRLSFVFAHKVFFLNPDDLREFVSRGLVRSEKAVLLRGIGVPLEEWPPVPPHLEPLTFTLIARLLKEKGVREFAEAACRVKTRHPEVRFLLIGPLDSNPGAIPEEEVRSWVEKGVLEWVPWTDDVRTYLRKTSVYVLPSYREGVPRSSQEAMAMARPVITTDAPGCRETVADGVNGFLVPPRDVEALVEAMEHFIRDPSLVERMGRESRKLAEERFDARKINERLLRELGIK